jgi:hypothetical protein
LKAKNKLKELFAIESTIHLDDFNKQNMTCELYKSTMEKTQVGHEVFILKANNIHDRIIDGVKK